MLTLSPVVWWLRREAVWVREAGRDWLRSRSRSREAEEAASRASLGLLPGLEVALAVGRGEGPVLWKASAAPLRAVWKVGSLGTGEEELGRCRLEEALGVTGRGMELQVGASRRGMGCSVCVCGNHLSAEMGLRGTERVS